jgi:DNA-binding transcriptional LysR family regulator
MHRLLDIDLRLIQVFRAIVEAQGLAGAQVVLGLSQSRVSASLAELERRLGLRLCRRGRSGFALTEAGAAIYAASLELFEAVDRFSNSAGAVSANVRRVLRLGTADAVITCPDLRLPEVLREFRRLMPMVTIDFLTAGPDDLEHQLVSGSRDVLIIPSLAVRADFAYTPLHAERQSLYCAAAHPLAHLPEDSLSTARLAEHPFVARGYLHSHDLKRIGHLHAEATVETMEAQLLLILSGAFVGYLPAHYAANWVAAGQLAVLSDQRLGYDSAFFAVTLTSKEVNPLIGRFLSILKDRCGGSAVASPPLL